jgi:hypothetical protein
VVQFYRHGKVRLAARDDIENVREELSFWFTNYPIDIAYKDPMVQLAFQRKSKINQFIATSKASTKRLLQARASDGHTSCTFIVDQANTPYSTAEWKHIYTILVGELCPVDSCTLEFDPQSPRKLTIWWLPYIGDLGKLSATSLKSKCKILLQDLFLKAEDECFQGVCTVSYKKSFRQVPSNFVEYFTQYAERKSDYPLNLTFYSTNLTLTMTFRVIIKIYLSFFIKKKKKKKKSSTVPCCTLR